MTNKLFNKYGMALQIRQSSHQHLLSVLPMSLMGSWLMGLR